jgi:hypothetical protein
MRESRPGAPAGHPPELADRPAETAVANPPAAPGEPRTETAVPASHAARAAEPGETPSAPLPRRVRGVNGARPPVAVERPVLSREFVERFQAAVAAAQARDADEPRAGDADEERAGDADEPRAGEGAAATPGAGQHEPGPGGEGPPGGESSPGAGRSLFVPAQPSGSDDSQPAERMVPEALALMALRERADAAEAITQPIPVISGAPPVPARDAAGPVAVPRQAAAPPQESSGRVPAIDRSADRAQRPRRTPSLPARSGRDGGRAGRTAGGAAARNDAGQQAKGAEKGGHWRYVLAGSVTTVVALAIAAGSFMALRGHRPAGHTALIPSARLPMPVRNGAGSWVASQVDAHDTVACDPVMCRVLQTHGMAAARLRVVWPGSDNISGCAVFVVTPILQAQLGARLESGYAPAVIARFGAGNRQIVVRAAAADSGPAYRSAAAHDLSYRQAAGAELAGELAALTTRGERQQLVAGEVDERLMVLLADLEGDRGRQVQVSAFGGGSPGVAATAAPLRAADLRITSQASARAILAELGAVGRDARLRPARVGPVRLPGGETALQVEYAAPSPMGLFG